MANTAINTKSSEIRIKDNPVLSPLRWTLITALFLLNLSFIFPSFGDLGFIVKSITALGICLLACLHGTKRYGLKNLAVFFVITFIVSNSFEALSIYMGFPFGNYHYTMSGLRILEVPLIIAPAYFGMGYMAWTLSHILNGQYGKRLKGRQVFFVPLIAAFIMVMWDVVMDPIAATINKAWIWEDGGNYFGVPISNFIGWFFVVYVFLQIFAIFIYKYDTKESENNFNKAFWFEAAIIYGIQGLSNLFQSITASGNKDIYSSMGLISVFTMIFVALISVISISNSKEISYDKNKINLVENKLSKKVQANNLNL
jgi:uncharacterized membrane protein